MNHVGDLEYFNGLIYAPVEEYKGSYDFSEPSIAVYDAWTGALVNWVDISGDRHEASAVTVVAEKGQVVISSYCPQNAGASTLWIYSLDEVTNRPAGSTLTKQGTVLLSSPLGRIQGISWDTQNGRFLVSADTGERAGTLWVISPGGTVTGPVYRVPSDQGTELEGVDATVGNAYYAENGYVYGIPMPGPPAETGGATETRPRNNEVLAGLPFVLREIAGRDRIRESSAGNAP